MDISTCQKYCFKKNYTYAGVEYGKECYCGNNINPSVSKPSSECNVSCEGDSSQMCGGSCRIQIYKNSGTFKNWFLENWFQTCQHWSGPELLIVMKLKFSLSLIIIVF